MKAAFIFKEKIILSLSKLLKQGLSISKLALVIALGMTLSIFPILGTTTLLCTLVALSFRLNLPAIQIANYVSFPLQIILFFPFLKLGEALSGTSLDPISKAQLVSTFEAGFLQAIQELFWYLLIASLGWLFSTVPIFIVLFYSLRAIIKRYGPTLVES